MRMAPGSVVSISLAAGLLTVPASRACAADARLASARARAAAVDAQVVWTTAVPVGFTTRIDSYHLINGVIYATGSDGRVRAVDAARGLYKWTASLGPGGHTIWGPVAYRSNNPEHAGVGVVFTTFSDAVLVDASSGWVRRRAKLPGPPTGSVVVYDKWVFSPAVGNRVYCSNVDDNNLNWQIGTRGPVQVPPVYIAREDLLVIADDAGVVHGSDSDRHRHFTRELGGKPRGWIAYDASAIYITTAGDLPAVHALDPRTGEPVRAPYRLAGRPLGGPILTSNAVYQALADGGLHCVGLTPETPNWFNPKARSFLAEWPGRVAVLRMDGQIEFVDRLTRRPAGVLDPGVRFNQAVSNRHNDAAFVATDKGEVWCLRPAGAGPLDTAAFMPATQPATQPAEPTPPAASPETTADAPPASEPPALPVEPSAPAAAIAPPPPPPAPAPPPGERHSLRGRIEDQLNRALDNRRGE